MAVIFEAARREPEGLALDDGVRRRTWAELEDRVQRTARWLTEDAGLVPGDHLALLLGNRAEGVEVLVAGILAGLWVTPVNTHLTPSEIAYVVEDAGARLLVADPSLAATARECHAGVVVAGSELDAALASARDEPLPDDGPVGGTMLYTSGTTGRPKGVKRARPAGRAAARRAWLDYARRVGLDGSGPHLVTGPLHHAAPLMFAVYDQLAGAPLHVLPRWDASTCLAWLAEREIAHTHMVPTMFVRLLRLPAAERAAFPGRRTGRAPAPSAASGAARRSARSPLRLVLHGAAPCSPAVKRRMIDWWGPVLVEYWGGTEGGVHTLVDSHEWLARPGTVGRAVPPWEVFAVDEDGRRLPPGETGLLYARHAQLDEPFAYHGDPAKTAKAYLAPGTLTLGDIGRVDAEGYVHLSDRAAHTIISGGVNIYPAEIEHVFAEHPAVADVAVFGAPDDEWGERVVAAVELRPGVEAGDALARELREFARRHLAGYKVPRTMDFEESLPRDASGKLFVRRLRDRHWKGREARI